MVDISTIDLEKVFVPNIVFNITTGTNNGAWDGSDTTRDIYEDIRLAISKLPYGDKPLYLIGKREIISMLICTKDSYEYPIINEILTLFGLFCFNYYYSMDKEQYRFIVENLLVGRVFVENDDVPDGYAILVSDHNNCVVIDVR
jgi:hypothetical protein